MPVKTKKSVKQVNKRQRNLSDSDGEINPLNEKRIPEVDEAVFNWIVAKRERAKAKADHDKAVAEALEERDDTVTSLLDAGKEYVVEVDQEFHKVSWHGEKSVSCEKLKKE